MKVKSGSEVAQSCVTLSDWPHRQQPTRLLHPWDFPGKSTGVGCHCLLHNPLEIDFCTLGIIFYMVNQILECSILNSPIPLTSSIIFHKASVYKICLCVFVSLIYLSANISYWYRQKHRYIDILIYSTIFTPRSTWFC